MGVRDQEISRLVKYAEALGVKVSFINRDSSHPADWVIDGSEIRIYTKKSYSKTDTILSLIHEIAHHLWFIYEKERQPDLKFEQAISIQNLVEEDLKTIAPKNVRKKILQVEKEGIKYWDIIIKDTNIKIADWKIQANKEFDIWNYEVYYETGSFATRKVRKDKWKQIKNKYFGGI